MLYYMLISSRQNVIMPRFWYQRIFWKTHVIHSTEDTNDLVLIWCWSRYKFIHVGTCHIWIYIYKYIRTTQNNKLKNCIYVVLKCSVNIIMGYRTITSFNIFHIWSNNRPLCYGSSFCPSCINIKTTFLQMKENKKDDLSYMNSSIITTNLLQ